MSRPSLSDLAKVLTDLTRASLQVTQLRRCIMNSADVTIIQVLGENAVQVIASLRSKGQSSGSTSPWSSASTALTGDPAKALVDEVFTRESDIHVRNTAAASSTTKLSTTQSNLTVTRPSTTAKLSGTVLVIRPHAVATGLAGPILEQIAKVGYPYDDLYLRLYFLFCSSLSPHLCPSCFICFTYSQPYYYLSILSPLPSLLSDVPLFYFFPLLLPPPPPLQSGFDASAIEMFVLDRPGAQEFCEVYKGVVPEYHGMVEQLTAGPLIAAELHYTSDDAKSVTKLREVCGPADPAVAQVLRPGTLRARFGQNKVLNAVHCTDLEEDGPLEAQYFFSILQQ